MHTCISSYANPGHTHTHTHTHTHSSRRNLLPHKCLTQSPHRKLKRAIPDPVSPLEQLLKSVAGEDKMEDCKSKLAAAGVTSVQAIQQVALALLCKVVGIRIAQDLKRGADQSLNS